MRSGSVLVLGVLGAALFACAAAGSATRIDDVVLAPVASSREPIVAAPSPSAASTCPPGFVSVPAGVLRMGSDPEEGDTDEEPVHEMALAAFCIGRTEVTVAEYERCAVAGACARPAKDELCNFGDASKRDHPINCVRWKDADDYCRYAGARLPTEAEWEYAARGADRRQFPWGNDAPDPASEPRACWDRELDKLATCAVGSFPAGASPFGALDMAGNVWEWTATPYCPYTQPECGSDRRVDRGGAWNTDEARRLRTAFRASGDLAVAKSYLGFRCARSSEAGASEAKQRVGAQGGS